MLERTRGHDDYPVGGVSDLVGFLSSDDRIEAWVVVDDGEIVGQVALHDHTGPAAMDMAARAADVDRSSMAAVARLVVDPAHRRRGIGRLLLDTARDEAHHLSLWPMLDVVKHHEKAIGMYEDAGWELLGEVDTDIGGGHTIHEFVFLGPRPPVSSG